MLLAACCLSLASSGCVKKPYPAGRLVVADVSLEGTEATSEDEILERLTTHRSARFLGIWEGVAFEYEILDEALLARDLARIERQYRALGYYEAKVIATRIERLDAHRARVQIRVLEGPPVITDRIEVQGVESLPLALAAAAIKAVTIRAGRPFLEANYEASKAELRSVLGDSGYALVDVAGKVDVDLPTHRATVRFTVSPGPLSHYGAITLVGLSEIPEQPIRETLLFREGDLYSAGDIKDAEDALAALGVFSKIDILQDRRPSASHTVPITIRVSEAKLRTLGIGVGATADAVRLATGLHTSWEDRNTLGGLRHVTIDARPGVNFFPARIDNITSNVLPLWELRSQIELRQPSFLEGRTTGFARGQFNLVPFLSVYDGDPKAAKVLGFRELKSTLGLERAFFRQHLLVTPSYNLDYRTPFIYGGTAANENIVASFPELGTTLDFRDNPLQPRKGLSLSVSAQANNQWLLGSANDLRLRPELRAFWPLSRRVVLATRATYGLLYSLNEPSDPAAAQLLRLVRGFYSGGPGSNRGYAFQGVNSQDTLELLTRQLDPDPNIACPLGNRREECRSQPIGGNQLWEASVEVRFPVLGALSGAAFIDSSDVFDKGEKLTFDAPHLSIGPGLRYLTPVGPVRADLGIRIPSLQEGRTTRPPAERPKHLLGLPAALHLSLGEDF